jgi:hypothetical protein
MRWVGHVARNGKNRVAYRDWLVDLRERDHLKDPEVDGRLIFKWIFCED